MLVLAFDIDQKSKYMLVDFKYSQNNKKPAHQLVGRQNAAAPEFDPKPSEPSFSTVLSL